MPYFLYKLMSSKRHTGHWLSVLPGYGMAGICDVQANLYRHYRVQTCPGTGAIYPYPDTGGRLHAGNYVRAHRQDTVAPP